jgi:hypothetical protein
MKSSIERAFTHELSRWNDGRPMAASRAIDRMHALLVRHGHILPRNSSFQQTTGASVLSLVALAGITDVAIQEAKKRSSRADFLRKLGFGAAALCAGGALSIAPRPARAWGIVYDPAAVSALLKQLGNDVVVNKQQLFLINLVLQQWQMMEYEHTLSIPLLFQDAGQAIDEFYPELANNIVLNNSVSKAAEIMANILPGWGSSLPYQMLASIYANYVQQAQAQAAVVASQSASILAKRQENYAPGGEFDQIHEQAAATGSNGDKFEYTADLSKSIDQGISVLIANTSQLMNQVGSYMTKQAQVDKNNDSALPAMFYQSLASNGTSLQQNARTVQGNAPSAQEYLNGHVPIPQITPTPVKY